MHPSHLTRLVVALLAAWVFLSPEARACDSCNRAFVQQVLQEREDTLAGQDILNAMRNQASLPLDSAIDEEALLAQAGTPGGAPPAVPRPSTGGTAPSQAPTPPQPADALNPIFAGANFIDIIRRDESLEARSTSYVPQDTEPDKRFTVVMDEGQVYIGQGVMYDGFTMDGSVPGKTLVVQEGDIVELTFENKGSVPHGASIHAAYTQTSKYVGDIPPGQSKSVVFRATVPGVYMYHCAPGGHAIPMHVLFGQYGMMVVEPKDAEYELERQLGHEPDVNLYLIQHEYYASGKEAMEGRPMYTAFNGKLFRYVEEPIVAKPGDYVRIHFLNIGPNLLSTFHIVGIIWDSVYWQGHPEARLPGGQTVTAGPSDSFVIEFRVPPDEGSYLMLSHAVGSTARGAIGVLAADAEAETPVTVKADGPSYTEEEIEEMKAEAVRTISPFDIGTTEVDRPVVYDDDQEEVHVQIIGNSFYPKVIEIEPGTKVTWTNEEVFTYMAGEFSGIHNAIGVSGPENFGTPLLAHAESASVTFTEPGTHEYICAPHPYMKGRIIVREPEVEVAEAASGCQSAGKVTAPLVIGGLALVGLGVARRRRGLATA